MKRFKENRFPMLVMTNVAYTFEISRLRQQQHAIETQSVELIGFNYSEHRESDPSKAIAASNERSMA